MQPLWETARLCLKNSNQELPHDPANPLLEFEIGTPLRRIENTCSYKTCTWIVTGAVFVMAPEWKEPKCPSANEQCQVTKVEQFVIATSLTFFFKGKQPMDWGGQCLTNGGTLPARAGAGGSFMER